MSAVGAKRERGPASPRAINEAVSRAIVGRRRDVRGRLFEIALLLTLILSLAVLMTLLVQVLLQGLPAFAKRGTGLFTAPLSADPSRTGLSQAFKGSLELMAFVVLIAFPLGIGAAIYLEEYARDTRPTRFLMANIRNLAGVPAIVYGLLGLSIFALALRGLTGPGQGRVGLTAVSGGLTLAVLVLPIVIITTIEALRAVPQSIREAGYGVGATKWEVTRSHVLPYAAPGVFTGTVLALARALGESAPLLLLGGATSFIASSGSVLHQLRGPYTTVPTTIFNWARLPGADFKHLTAAASLVLVVLILLINGTAILLRNRYERRW